MANHASVPLSQAGPGAGAAAPEPGVADAGLPERSVVPTVPEVEVRPSTRRRKTASARWEGGRIVVMVPSGMVGPDRDAMVARLVGRVLSRRPAVIFDDDALQRRAEALGRAYLGGVAPRRVRWVTNQGTRWGSCTSATGEIRLSHRLRQVPGWVLDAVMVHELAHLVHPDHSDAFHALADRAPRQREARVFLEGYALGLEAPRNGVTPAPSAGT